MTLLNVGLQKGRLKREPKRASDLQKSMDVGRIKYFYKFMPFVAALFPPLLPNPPVFSVERNTKWGVSGVGLQLHLQVISSPASFLDMAFYSMLFPCVVHCVKLLLSLLHQQEKRREKPVGCHFLCPRFCGKSLFFVSFPFSSGSASFNTESEKAFFFVACL